MRAPMSQEDFEAEIADDVSENRGELHVEQVTPDFRVPYAAYLRIKPECLEAAMAFSDQVSERVARR